MDMDQFWKDLKKYHSLGYLIGCAHSHKNPDGTQEEGMLRGGRLMAEHMRLQLQAFLMAVRFLTTLPLPREPGQDSPALPVDIERGGPSRLPHAARRREIPGRPRIRPGRTIGTGHGVRGLR